MPVALPQAARLQGYDYLWPRAFHSYLEALPDVHQSDYPVWRERLIAGPYQIWEYDEGSPRWRTIQAPMVPHPRTVPRGSPVYDCHQVRYWDGHRRRTVALATGPSPAVLVDHIQPVNHGGHERTNLEAICSRCHATKTKRWGWPVKGGIEGRITGLDGLESERQSKYARAEFLVGTPLTIVKSHFNGLFQ